MTGPLRSERSSSRIRISQVDSNEADATEALAKRFSAYSEDRGRWSFIWSAIVLAVLLAAAVATIMLLKSAHIVTWRDAIARLGISVPIYAAAGYAARVASQNRNLAMQAWMVSIQASSINAYSETLPEDAREALRYEFGRRIFGELCNGIEPDRTTRSQTVPDILDSFRLINPSSRRRTRAGQGHKQA
jgi:hypothetical protein